MALAQVGLGGVVGVAVLVVIAGGDHLALIQPLGSGHGGLGVVQLGLGLLDGRLAGGMSSGRGATCSLWSWALTQTQLGLPDRELGLESRSSILKRERPP